jgi:hypothetical protein
MKQPQDNILARASNWIQTNKSWFQLTKDTLTELHKARDGGSFSKTMAALSISGLILERVAGRPTALSVLEHLKFNEMESPVSGFLCDMLNRETPTEIMNFHTEEILFWGEERSLAAIYTCTGEYHRGPFIRGGEEEFEKRIIRNIWDKGKDLALHQAEGFRYYYKCSGKFETVPVLPPGPYLGKKDHEYYLNRLRRYGDTPRTILIQGPTGSGKSVLARHVSRGLGVSGRALKVEGDKLSIWNSANLPELVKYLQPSTLIVDDLQFGNDIVPLLGILESLRVEGRLIIITRMVDLSEKIKRGDSFIEGFRPGRIDEVINLYPPDREDRDLILRTNFKDNIPREEIYSLILDKTKGLTGAYLAEIAKRISLYGEEHWEEELESILYFAPPEKEVKKKTSEVDEKTVLEVIK